MADFPELKNYIGKTLIVTDGSSLLGADDKAGVTEILEAMKYLKAHPEIPHGKVRVALLLMKKLEEEPIYLILKLLIVTSPIR